MQLTENAPPAQVYLKKTRCCQCHQQQLFPTYCLLSQRVPWLPYNKRSHPFMPTQRLLLPKLRHYMLLQPKMSSHHLLICPFSWDPRRRHLENTKLPLNLIFVCCIDVSIDYTKTRLAQCCQSCVTGSLFVQRCCLSDEQLFAIATYGKVSFTCHCILLLWRQSTKKLQLQVRAQTVDIANPTTIQNRLALNKRSLNSTSKSVLLNYVLKHGTHSEYDTAHELSR